MDNYNRLLKIKNSHETSTLELQAFFETLEPVSLDFMMGQWKGCGFNSTHPMDGLLETFNWYGKYFISPEQVHPLLFKRKNASIVALNPIFFPMRRLKMHKIYALPLVRYLFNVLTYVFKTNQPKARLRMLEFQGKVSATMIYDTKPINDIFRRVNDTTVLGLMDLKGLDRPFFFILEKDNPSRLSS